MDNEVMLKNFKDMLGFYGENISAAKYDAIINANKPAGRTLRRRFGSWLKAKNLALGKEEPQQPKILLLDIETAPMEVLVWGLYKQHIPYENVLKEWSILTWAAKWMFESSVMHKSVSPKDAANRKDAKVLGELWQLLDEADIIIGHNVRSFDLRKINARLHLAGYSPPSPYQIIDTLKEAQKVMSFSSYSLDYLNKVIGNNRKIKTGYGLWKRCIGIDNDSSDQYKALTTMSTYNQQDVNITEELYLSLRPWIKTHPNLGLYYSDMTYSRCRNCGGVNLTPVGEYYTPMSRYKAIRCGNCGAIGRERISDLTKEERANLVAAAVR